MSSFIYIALPRGLYRVQRVLCLLACLLATVLLISACQGSARSPSTLQIRLPTPTIIDRRPTDTPAFSTAAALSGASLQKSLDAVESDAVISTVGALMNFNSRHVLSVGISSARDWLIDQFDVLKNKYPDRGIAVFTQPFSYTWNNQAVQADNVVVIFPGAEVGGGVVIIGAHYDSIGQPFTDGTAYAPGANDNGSGVAALLETARILAPYSHRATIIFVCFAAEETGRQGSIAFVNEYLQAQNPPVDVRAMLNLDIIGSPFGENGVTDPHTLRIFSAEPNTSPSRQLARTLALVASTYLADDTRIAVQSAEERRGRWGDHQSFSAVGYPAVRLIQGIEDPSRQHTGRDTLDGIQPAYLVRATRVVVATTLVLADGPPPPVGLAVSRAANNPASMQLIWQPVPGITRYLVALRKEASVNYDQVLSADGVDNITWAGLGDYQHVAVAAVTADGLIGALSTEITIR